MRQHVELSQVYVVLLFTVFGTHANISDSFFTTLDEGQSIIGKTETQLTAKTSRHCSIMCLNDVQCKAYQHKKREPENCILIQNNCGNTERQMFETDDNTAIYEKGLVPNSGWRAPEVAFYESFDGSEGLVLKEGLSQADTFSLVSGKVNCAILLNHTENQWIDLGIHTESCMTQPDTCGAAGGAISLWVNVLECPSPHGGIISSRIPTTKGSVIFCISGETWVEVAVLNGYFTTRFNTTSRWTHLVLNYLGPNNGQGIRMFVDGQEVATGTIRMSRTGSGSGGRVVVGKVFANDISKKYASLQVDELIFFNQALNQDEISTLYNVI